MNFRYSTLPWNIIFGVDSLQRLPVELKMLGRSRALVLTTPTQANIGQHVVEILQDSCVGLYDQAVMHVPAATASDASEVARSLNADCTVAIGGGSTTGLGKILALKADLDNIAIPTSYAGSEMTNIWGITDDGKKVIGRDDRVVPTLTIYDPVLTLSLPPKFAASSGLNAMAQAAVNVASLESNPIVNIMARDAVKALSKSLPRILEAPDDLDARELALYGACLAGGALGTGTTSLHHRLCHTFGGTFNTPHAETHTVLLAHSIAYNASAAKEGTAQLAEALGVDDAALGIYELARRLGAPTTLKQLGVLEADLDKAAAISVEAPISNPAPVTLERVRKLLDDAFHGRPPEIEKER
jgi:maleylacetate reductase